VSPHATTTPRLELRLPGRGETVALAPGEALLIDGDASPVVRALVGGGSAGWARLDGVRLRGEIARRVRGGLGIVRDVPVAPEVSVLDHLAARVGADTAERALEGAPLLAGRGGDLAGVLSGGERTVLAWLRALVTGPRALLLLRAGEGLDEATLAWAADRVAEQRARGVSVVVVAGRPQERAWAEPGGRLWLPG